MPVRFLSRPVALAVFLAHSFSAVALGATVQSLLDVPFTTAQGGNIVLSPALGKRGLLVAFWANWCVPCKEELALLQRNSARLEGLTLVAVNVDEASDWPGASSTLSAIGWTGLALRDTGGTFFYDMNPAGDLPYAAWFDAKGGLVRVMKKVDESVVDELADRKDEESSAKRFSLHDDARTLIGRRGNRDRAAVSNSLSLRYSGGGFDAAATHDVLRQKKDGDWSRWEDDLGRSHLQYSLSLPLPSSDEEGRATLRVGDDHVNWMEGQLFAVRPSPVSPELRVVQGGHAGLTVRNFSLQVMGGHVRQLLVPNFLLLDRDLSRDFPRNRVGGAVLRASAEVTKDVSVFAGGGLVRVLRLKDKQDGQPRTVGNNHTGVFGGAKAYGTDVVARYTRYLADDSAGPESDGFAFQADAGVPMWPSQALSVQASGNETRRLPDLAFVPALVDTLGIPLDSPDKRALRGALRWDPKFGSTSVSALSYFTQERSRYAPALDRKNHWGASVALPVQSVKVAGYHAKGTLGSLKETTRDRAAQVSAPVYGPLSGQYLYKDVKDPRSGHQHKANLDLNVSRALGIEDNGRLGIEVARVWQDGQMRRTSGLDAATASAAYVTWKSEAFTARAGGGREPGGIVCADGVCAQRPPLDGLHAEARVDLRF